MSVAPVIVDTNVVVAGLLSANAAAPVARILDGMLVAAFPFVVSAALLAEYHAVLSRTEIRKRHGLTAVEIESLLTDIAQYAIVLESGGQSTKAAPDPGDQLLWDLLAGRADLTLVTGDHALLRDPVMRGRVISPKEYIERAGNP